MDQTTTPDIPPYPRLRVVEPSWVEFQGQRCLYLRDPLGLTDTAAIVPHGLAPLLALCDGTRDLAALRTGLELRTGIHLTPPEVERFFAQLDGALLLENGAYQTAARQALKEYREAPYRNLSHAGAVYPPEPEAAAATLQGYCDQEQDGHVTSDRPGDLVGMVCPHIDYQRGGSTYGRLWRRAASRLDDVELVVIFGTDHSGGPGALTLTRQSYATPFGVLPTDLEIVDGLARVLGEERVYAEEVHHIGEHSIELAAVWLHRFLEGRAVPVVPILCGSFQPFVEGDGDPAQDEVLAAALDFLKNATGGRRTLAIASGDLAHVGPAFGDPLPVDIAGSARLRANDNNSIAAICRGDAAAFLDISKRERDTRRLCGLPPIYMALSLVGPVAGDALGYGQCPAGDDGGSLVSIAGVLLYEDGGPTSA